MDTLSSRLYKLVALTPEWRGKVPFADEPVLGVTVIYGVYAQTSKGFLASLEMTFRVVNSQ
jgi:hypothetical protein